ncbi:MAG TPA: electron transfer flavoprotein [Ruminococcus sp.]|nr:electron transfer flavoprotein [Ruminococcus sp.]
MENDKARVVLCIKPVKSTLTGKHSADHAEMFQMNPYEVKVLKELVALKKAAGDSFLLTCLCMGAKASESVLRRAIAMGADEAVLVSDPAYSGSDTVATSYILTGALQKLEHVQLIVCGCRSIDGETGQVPIALSERMGFALYTSISEITEISTQGLIFRKQESDFVVTHRGQMPAVVTYDGFQVKEESISLPALKRAKRKEIPCWDHKILGLTLSRCGLEGSKTAVSEIHSGFTKKAGQQFLGTTDETAMLLSGILKGVGNG